MSIECCSGILSGSNTHLLIRQVLEGVSVKVDHYYNYAADDNPASLTFTRNAASAFAKEVAGDFNPIHNPDARRFCVPGDLLFAVVLDLYQAHASMKFDFEHMVGDQVSLELKLQESSLQMVDAAGRCYLDVAFSGNKVKSAAANHALIAAYVKFSGKTFPFLLVELMKKHEVMINPQRPLIIYKSMSIELHDINSDSFDLALTDSTLNADGKKGEVTLNFNIVSGDQVVGTGCKNMLLGGLREYQQDVSEEIVSEYNSIKSRYLAEHI